MCVQNIIINRICFFIFDAHGICQFFLIANCCRFYLNLSRYSQTGPNFVFVIFSLSLFFLILKRPSNCKTSRPYKIWICTCQK